MKPVPKPGIIALPARSVHRIVDGRGLLVACLQGAAWVTQTRDPRDIVLQSGDSFVLDRDGLTLLMALAASQITIGPPTPSCQPPPWWKVGPT
jgi:hypothetical protein